VRLNSDKSLRKTIMPNWQITNAQQSNVLDVQHSGHAQVPTVHVALTLSRVSVNEITLRQTALAAAATRAAEISAAGQRDRVAELLGLPDTLTRGFAIVEPRRPRCRRTDPTWVRRGARGRPDDS